MKRNISFLLLLILLALLPLGCGGGHKNDLSLVLSRYGSPEETEVVYSPDGISYLVLWYWSQGRGFKLKEESYLYVRGLECEEKYYWMLVEEYHFTPPSSKEEIEKLKRKFTGGEIVER